MSVGGYAIIKDREGLLFSSTSPSPAQFFENRFSDKAVEPRHGRLALVIYPYFASSPFEARINNYGTYVWSNGITIFGSSASQYLPMDLHYPFLSCVILSCASSPLPSPRGEKH